MSFIAEFLAQRFVGIRGGVSLNRGARALAAGDGPEAVKWFEDAVSAKSAAMGSATHPTVAKAMTQLAAAHRRAKEPFRSRLAHALPRWRGGRGAR